VARAAVDPLSVRSLTRRQTADVMGLTAQAIGHLAKEPGCPKESRDGRDFFVFPDFNRWYWHRKIEEARHSEEDSSYEVAQARREMAKAQQEELRLAQMRRELMTVQEWESTYLDASSRVRSHLIALPHRLAPYLVGCTTTAEAHRRIVPLVDEIVAELQSAEDIPLDDAEETAA